MTIFMYKNIIFITNRKLVKKVSNNETEDFLQRIKCIASKKPYAIVLREKDLSEKEYFCLAAKVLEICKESNVLCVLHSFSKVAKELGCKSIHMPLEKLKKLSDEEKAYFTTIGASCHSVEDAILARNLGANYITAGHVFATDCKKGLAPRGLDFLEKVVKSVDIPVFGIGGINMELEKLKQVLSTGAKGSCIMSYAMQEKL